MAMEVGHSPISLLVVANNLDAAQEIFYEDSDVFYVSIHATGDYPCTFSDDDNFSFE